MREYPISVDSVEANTMEFNYKKLSRICNNFKLENFVMSIEGLKIQYCTKVCCVKYQNEDMWYFTSLAGG